MEKFTVRFQMRVWCYFLNVKGYQINLFYLAKLREKIFHSTIHLSL